MLYLDRPAFRPGTLQSFRLDLPIIATSGAHLPQLRKIPALRMWRTGPIKSNSTLRKPYLRLRDASEAKGPRKDEDQHRSRPGSLLG